MHNCLLIMTAQELKDEILGTGIMENVFEAPKCDSFILCESWDLRGEYHSNTG
jgi:hypothetical protein